MKPTAPPVKRGRPGTATARYFAITRSTTSSPSRTHGVLSAGSIAGRGSGAGLPVADPKGLDDLAVFNDLDAGRRSAG